MLVWMIVWYEYVLTWGHADYDRTWRFGLWCVSCGCCAVWRPAWCVSPWGLLAVPLGSNRWRYVDIHRGNWDSGCDKGAGHSLQGLDHSRYQTTALPCSSLLNCFRTSSEHLRDVKTCTPAWSQSYIRFPKKNILSFFVIM